MLFMLSLCRPAFAIVDRTLSFILACASLAPPSSFTTFSNSHAAHGHSPFRPFAIQP